MGFLNLRSFTAALCAAMLFLVPASGAFAQGGGDNKSPEQQKAEAAAKETQKRIDEIAEAGRLVNGAAGTPECVYLGRLVLSLLSNSDLDTAFRHLDLYDRFGCPGSHVQVAFRCLVRQGIDPKARDVIGRAIQACWINPGTQPSPAAAQATPPAADGTSTR
jgi:hypothetical protein